MRRVLILISVAAVAVACAKTETPPADTAAAMAPTPMAVVLTDADVAGAWKGTNTPMGSDSVISRWTMVCGAGTCKGNVEGVKETYVATYTISGDSIIAASQPFADPTVKGTKVIDMWVSHFSGANVMGTGAEKLVSKPDSVVNPYRFTGTVTH